LLAGLGGQNGTDGLFSLGAKPELPLWQVKSWGIWWCFAKSGPSSEKLCTSLQKRERRRWIPSIQSSWVGPASRRSSTYWRSASHAGQLRKLWGQMSKQFQK
jgi:hypothetical protein